MARNLSAEKRVRQDARKRVMHRSVKTYIKNRIKEFKAEQDPAKKQELLNHLYSVLDKAAKKGVFHAKTVARKKSRLAAVMRRDS